jgi:hypothetical protein
MKNGFLVVFSFLLLPTCLPSQAPGGTHLSPPAVSDNLPPASTLIDDATVAAGLLTPWTEDDENGNLVPIATGFATFGNADLCKDKKGACIASLDPDYPNPSEKNMYVVHILQSETKEGSAIGIHSSRWYVFRYNSASKAFTLRVHQGKGEKNGTVSDLYNVSNGYLISISVLKPAASTPPSIAYSIKPTENTPANIAALQALISAVANVSLPTRSPGFLEVKSAVAVQVRKFSSKELKAPFSVQIDATVSSKINGDSGDCSNVTTKTSCPISQTFNVKGREWVNFGVNVVAWGPLEKKYDLTKDNKVEMTSTRHAPLYAVVDISPWYAKGPMSKWPYLQAGIPLSGSAFHIPYAGAALPFPIIKSFPVSLYGGVAFMRQKYLTNLAVGQTTDSTTLNSNLHVNWPRKGMFGVEVPVSSISKSIKSKVGSQK